MRLFRGTLFLIYIFAVPIIFFISYIIIKIRNNRIPTNEEIDKYDEYLR